MVAPALVTLNLAGWLGIQILGFCLVYYPAVTAHRFNVGRAGHSFGTALYFSAGSLTSLSFSDVQPKSLAYHAVAAVETLVGLSILTLAISYVLNLYRVLQNQGVLSSQLYHQSRGSNQPYALLEPHFVGGEARGIGTMVRELHRNLTEHHEGMRRYPVVWYFHTRRPYRSLPYLFWFTGAAAGALRWGLPRGHPETADPWLSGLIAGYEDVLDQVARSFLPRPLPPPEPPASLAEFGQALDNEVDDDLLRRFLETERAMHEMANAEPTTDVAARYERYCQWAAFAGRGRSFVQMASRDLGLDPEALIEEPIQPRF
jgi:hypothetical protein